MPTYLSTVLGLPRPRALLLVLVTMVVILGIVVVLGRYSDRVGRLPIVGAGCVALVVLSLPLFLLMGVGSTAAVLGALLLLGLILICFSSTMPATLPALFATRTRYSGVAVSYNISVAAFGGTTPLIAEALVAGTGYRQVPAVLLMVAGLVGLVAVYFTRESSNRPLPGSPPMTSDRHDG